MLAAGTDAGDELKAKAPKISLRTSQKMQGTSAWSS